MQLVSRPDGPLIDVNEVEEVLQEFIYRYQVFSHETGNFRDDKKDLMEFQLTMMELNKELTRRYAFTEESVHRSNLDNQTNPENLRKRSLQTSEEQFVLPSDSNGAEEDSNKLQYTPQGAKKKLKFARVTPKTDLVPTFSCDICGKKYGWLKSLGRHLRDQHNGAVLPPNLTENKDYITCRMCKRKHLRENIARHLLETHKVRKVGTKGAVFRGFLTFDDVNWQPLWLQKGESDPSAEESIMVPVNEGKVTLYGIDFQVEEVICDGSAEEMTSTVNEENISRAKSDHDEKVSNVKPSEDKSIEKSKLEKEYLQEMEPFGTPLNETCSNEENRFSNPIPKSSVVRRLDFQLSVADLSVADRVLWR